MAPIDAKAMLATVPGRPGVYRMLDAAGKVLYVGKARDLRRRVGSYFSRSLSYRLQVMVEQVEQVEVTVTRTEAEALLLENNLIKSLKPRYNVLLRDDKSYPYIYLSVQEPFPRLGFYRGARKEAGRYFGPYPSASAVRETLQLLQKLFPVRQCEEGFYRNRSRPCLQHQMHRCTAPCVGLVSEEAYRQDVEHTILFLEGKTNEVVADLGVRMERAAEELEFERAAAFRDQIATLRRIQERQYVSGERGDLDIVTCAAEGGLACVQVFFVRAGRNLGNKSFFPKVPEGADAPLILSGFLSQYYLDKQVPAEIICSAEPEERAIIEAALSERSGRRIAIRHRVRGERFRWLQMAQGNAALAVRARLGSQAGYTRRVEALRKLLGQAELPRRIECFDVSHTGGERTVASCVVFDQAGPHKSDYRRFNIEGVAAGDDYGALRQALLRRYTRTRNGEHAIPDVLFVDGGKGQVSTAAEVLQELGVCGLALVGIAKGPDRKPGMEQLWLYDRSSPITLPNDSPAMHLIQQVRDEAHRFAVTGHRLRRTKARTTSVLEGIPGIGPKRRQQLLRQFGGIQELARAEVEDLARVEGISQALAQQIYSVLHGDAP